MRVRLDLLHIVGAYVIAVGLPLTLISTQGLISRAQVENAPHIMDQYLAFGMAYFPFVLVGLSSFIYRSLSFILYLGLAALTTAATAVLVLHSYGGFPRSAEDMVVALVRVFVNPVVITGPCVLGSIQGWHLRRMSRESPHKASHV